MVVSEWVINILGIIFAIISALIIIIKILPRISELGQAIFNDDAIVGNLMSLIIILVYILLTFTIVGLIKNINNKVLNYIGVIDPGIELLSAMLPYFKWIIFALLIAAAIKQFRK